MERPHVDDNLTTAQNVFVFTFRGCMARAHTDIVPVLQWEISESLRLVRLNMNNGAVQVLVGPVDIIKYSVWE